MFKYFFLSIIIIFSLCFCNSKKTNTIDIYKEIDGNSALSDHIICEIPIDKNGLQADKVDWIYSYIKKQTSDLGLDSLQSGYKGIQIRIWLHGWLLIKKDLIILSRTNKKWEGKLITATYKYNDSIKDHFISDKEIKTINPKSGWDSLFKSLLDLKLLTLPDMNKLPDYSRGDDGTDFVFEIATASHYKMFHYWSPSYYADKFGEAKNVVLISTLLQKEFF
jgi:hypothetical protein